ncbi:MAG: hypothetical protein COA99_09015 [Moraxellaceae bacterium]|nr:MAG: hypothetical protein COA99_09015 [Moraxellaceae bacterium]
MMTLTGAGGHESDSEDIKIADILNITLYHSVLLTKKNPALPPLIQLAAYHKIKPEINAVTCDNELNIVSEHRDLFMSIIKSIS